MRLCQLNQQRHQTDTSGYNTTCDTLEGIHARGRAQPIPDTTATPGRCTGQHSPPIIIRYIRGCRGATCYESMPDSAAYCRPCQRRRVSSYRLRIRWQVLTRCQQHRPGAPAEGSASPPVQSQPGGLQSGTGSAVRPGILAPSTRRGSPAAGGAEPLAALAASLFGLSPDS